MEYWRTLMISKLPDVHLTDTEKTIAVLNSQDADLYEEMRGLLREYPRSPHRVRKDIASETVSNSNKQTVLFRTTNPTQVVDVMKAIRS